MKIDGQWCENPIKVKDEIKKYFEMRFATQSKINLNMDSVHFRSISDANMDLIFEIISEQEILEVVKQCGCSKSPRPDGYNFYFIKNNWGIVGQDIVRAVYCFQEMGHIPHGCNAFITLVSMRNNSSNLNDFRLISLVVYKEISKILANKIKRVLPLVIDKSQSAFFSGRGLLDIVLVVNETIDYLKKENLRGEF